MTTAFDPPSSDDSQAYDSAADADRVEIVAGAAVIGTVDQGTGGVSAWLVSINGVPHVVVDSATIAALTDGTQRVGGTVTVSGAVSVSNFPAIQPVSGTVAVSAVGGTVTTDGSGHVQPVSGTVAATQGTSPWVVDGSAVTQPVSLASSPLPSGAATDTTVDRVRVAVRESQFDAWLHLDETRWA